MGLLINGKWTHEEQPVPAGPHQHSLGTEEFPFDATKDQGRYHLYVSHVCPFAHRALIALALKKLGSAIDVSVSSPENTTEGWSFNSEGYPEADDIRDKVLGKKLLHEVYTAADPNYTGRVTVPLLIDTKPGQHNLGGSGKIRIVSNESADIVDIFDKISSSGPQLSLHSDEQKKANELTQKYTSSVFKFVGITKQDEYDTAIEAFYGVVEALDAALANTKFLAGDEPTAVDVRIFPFFVRFEISQAILFQITRARLSDYPNLGTYIRRFYQLPGVKETVSIHHIRSGAFSEYSLNKFKPKYERTLIPALPQLDWETPLA